MRTNIERFEGLSAGDETQVVRADHSWEMNSATRSGFRISHSWVESGAVDLDTPQGKKQVLGPVRFFLMVRPQGDALAAKCKELEESQRERYELSAKCKELEAAAKKTATELEQLRTDKRQLSEASARHAEIRSRLEVDVGKLREAIGSSRFKEILGEEKPF